MSGSVAPGSLVVAVDGSGHARHAAEWAARQALATHEPLVVVTVPDGSPTAATGEAVADELRQLYPALEVRPLAIPGEPRDVLLALSRQAGLLVVGSRGRGPLKSLLLGSVSGTLSSYADCPVVVCRPDGAELRRGGVVVGVDGTADSAPVIEFAFRQAALHDLPLTVLHCFWDAVAAVAEYRERRGEVTDPPELEDLHALVAESVAGMAEEYPDVQVAFELRHGLVDEALSPRDDGWDLVVVGRHPMNSLSRVLTGSIATTVVERSRTTVAVVPIP